MAVFRRGARRLADRTTYLIVLVTVSVAIVPPGLLAVAFARHSGRGLAVVACVFALWSWLVAIFGWGAMTIAATEQPGLRAPGAVLRATLSRFVTFFGVALILLGAALAVGLFLVVLALVGLGGTTTAPILALLTPVFLVVGGLGLLAVTTVARLAFVSVAYDSSRSIDAIRAAWLLVRTRLADVLLWLLGEGALIVGGLSAIVSVVVVGAGVGVGIEVAFFGAGLATNLASGSTNAKPGVVGAVIALIMIDFFVAMVAGAVAGFTTGTAAGFYRDVQLASDDVQSASGEVPASLAVARGFCDRCGAPRTNEAFFCDACGASVVMA